MGYCDPKWIGDYSYKAILNYLSPVSPLVASAVVREAVQPCLLIWGHIRDGEMVLEPAFQVNTRPSLPRRSGPYSVSAAGENGATLFNFSFAPKEIADLPGGQQELCLRGAGLGCSSQAGGHPPPQRSRPTDGSQGRRLACGHAAGHRGTPQSPSVRRLASGGTGIQWDAGAHPMVMVRDARTGEVLSLARGGSVQLPGVRARGRPRALEWGHEQRQAGSGSAVIKLAIVGLTLGLSRLRCTGPSRSGPGAQRGHGTERRQSAWNARPASAPARCTPSPSRLRARSPSRAGPTFASSARRPARFPHGGSTLCWSSSRKPDTSALPAATPPPSRPVDATSPICPRRSPRSASAAGPSASSTITDAVRRPARSRCWRSESMRSWAQASGLGLRSER